MLELHEGLARARERVRLSQEDVGAAIGVTRVMVSHWETGQRPINDRQLAALARLYGVSLADLIEGADPHAVAGQASRMLLRAQPTSVASPGLEAFERFLDRFADLADLAKSPIRGLTQSPFVHRQPFTDKKDARRKAEEVRGHLGLGAGPIPDVDAICEMLGITIYRAPLGSDLRESPSGAFYNHPRAGFSILVNLDMTPGRRRFTAAHEIAHALFHSDEPFVLSLERNPRETFADEFAGEFLMPSEGIRRYMEDADMGVRVKDAAEVVHIQRYFRVSFPTALVRLRVMKALSADLFDHLRSSVRPVALAQALGYRIDPEEYSQDPELWTVRRFPRRFLRMLSNAVAHNLMSPQTAASFAELALEELLDLIGEPDDSGDPPQDGIAEGVAAEFDEFERSGVI